MKKNKRTTVSYVVGVDCSLASPLEVTHFIEEAPANDVEPDHVSQIHSAKHCSSHKNTKRNTGRSNRND